MGNIVDFFKFKKDESLDALANYAVDAFISGFNNRIRFDIEIKQIETGTAVLANDKILFVLSKEKNDKIKVTPYTLIVEGDFLLPEKNVIEFFKRAGEVYERHAPLQDKFSKRRNVQDWTKAKLEMENLVTVYSSDKLIKTVNIGILTD